MRTHTHTHTSIFKTSNDFHEIETIHRQTKQHSIALVVMWLFFNCCRKPVLSAGEKLKHSSKFMVLMGNSEALKKANVIMGTCLMNLCSQPSLQLAPSCAYQQPHPFHLLTGQMCLVLLLCNHNLLSACSCLQLCILSWAAICFTLILL